MKSGRVAVKLILVLIILLAFFNFIEIRLEKFMAVNMMQGILANTIEQHEQWNFGLELRETPIHEGLFK